MNEDIEKIEKLLARHQKWLNKLPVPTEGCLYQMMNVIGEAQRLLEQMKLENTTKDRDVFEEIVEGFNSLAVERETIPNNILFPDGHYKCLVCGNIHPDGLPCPEMKIT